MNEWYRFKVFYRYKSVNSIQVGYSSHENLIASAAGFSVQNLSIERPVPWRVCSEERHWNLSTEWQNGTSSETLSIISSSSRSVRNEIDLQRKRLCSNNKWPWNLYKWKRVARTCSDSIVTLITRIHALKHHIPIMKRGSCSASETTVWRMLYIQTTQRTESPHRFEGIRWRPELRITGL
jgi:hypothetical protein